MKLAVLGALLAYFVPQVIAFLPSSTHRSLLSPSTAPSHAKVFNRRAVILKPTLIVQTSVEKTKEESDAFLVEASKAVSKGLGKPESYVMVSHTTTNLRFAGTDEPAAFCYLASIGRIPEANGEMAPVLTELVGKHFGVKPARIFIQFVNCAAENFAWNGRTFG